MSANNPQCEVKLEKRSPHCLLQDLSTVVDDALKGIVMTNQGLVLLEGTRVIMRRDHENMNGKVKIIGGGGAGLEPAEACYVGAGMLTAAVIGDIFTSPPANVILRAIRELGKDHREGILLLAKNYTGDRLNFGVALERALLEGFVVKMLVIGEDGADWKPGKMGRRGLAGSAFVYKIAGAMAEDCKGLDQIFTACREATVTDLSTITLALSLNTIQGCGAKNVILKDDEVILGLGPHGQVGAKKIKIQSVSDAVHSALEILSASSNQTRIHFDENPVAILINNLGGSSKLEELVVAMETIKQLGERQIQVIRRYCGTFMPSLDMKGFSISILKITSPDTTKYLDASTSAPGWPRTCCAKCADPNLSADSDLPLTVPTIAKTIDKGIEVFDVPIGPELSETGTLALDQIAGFAVEALIANETQLNVMDGEMGDKDTGTRLKKGAEAVKNALKEGHLNTSHPYCFLKGIAYLFENAMGGTLGALYGIFFNAGADIFLNEDDITARSWCLAFRTGVKAVKHYGHAEVGDRSMLDALCPAVDSLEKALKNQTPYSALYNAAATCEYHSNETKPLPPQVGRAARNKREAIYADPGAQAATVWMRAIVDGVKLKFPQ